MMLATYSLDASFRSSTPGPPPLTNDRVPALLTLTGLPAAALRGGW
ncbi:hypothetical protein [Kribbella sp. NPDC004875]